jgi:hypothetical protein
MSLVRTIYLWWFGAGLMVVIATRTSNQSRGNGEDNALLPIGGPEIFQGHGSRVRFAPVAHRVQQRSERPSERSNGVYHSRGSVRVHSTLHNSCALQIAELLGERSLRDARNRAF